MPSRKPESSDGYTLFEAYCLGALLITTHVLVHGVGVPQLLLWHSNAACMRWRGTRCSVHLPAIRASHSQLVRGDSREVEPCAIIRVLVICLHCLGICMTERPISQSMVVPCDPCLRAGSRRAYSSTDKVLPWWPGRLPQHITALRNAQHKGIVQWFRMG